MFEAFRREGRAGTQIKANQIEAGQGTEGKCQKVKVQEVLGCHLFLSGLQDAPRIIELLVTSCSEL